LSFSLKRHIFLWGKPLAAGSVWAVLPTGRRTFGHLNQGTG